MIVISSDCNRAQIFTCIFIVHKCFCQRDKTFLSFLFALIRINVLAHQIQIVAGFASCLIRCSFVVSANLSFHGTTAYIFLRKVCFGLHTNDEIKAGKVRVTIPNLSFFGEGHLIDERLGDFLDGHYMPADLLTSQFEALEEPDDAITVSVEQTPDEIIREIKQKSSNLCTKSMVCTE